MREPDYCLTKTSWGLFFASVGEVKHKKKSLSNIKTKQNIDHPKLFDSAGIQLLENALMAFPAWVKRMII
jgi:hypothetical protein